MKQLVEVHRTALDYYDEEGLASCSAYCPGRSTSCMRLGSAIAESASLFSSDNLLGSRQARASTRA